MDATASDIVDIIRAQYTNGRFVISNELAIEAVNLFASTKVSRFEANAIRSVLKEWKINRPSHALGEPA